MIFYVYIEPQIILDASNKGTHALQSLIGILRNFLQNCFIAGFEDYRTQHAIMGHVNDITDVQSKILIQSLFKQLSKRRLFIYCLIPDYSGEKKDIVCAVEQASSSLLDLLLVADNRDIEESSAYEIATLETYQFTNFESKRSELVKDGKIWNEGALPQNDFLNENFKKALRFAEEIIICDMIFGKKSAAANFMYTILTMSRWLGKVLPDPFNLKRLIVHCEKPPGKGDYYVNDQLEKIKRGRLSNLKIKIKFYQKIDRESLPHDRFILTNQVAFFVGRGMDFLCEKTKTNRDVTINYLNTQELHKFLDDYRPNLVAGLFQRSNP